jgi:hypothetical protein
VEFRTIIERLWRCRRAVAVVAMLAAAAAVTSAYRVSISPLGIAPKDFKFAVANTQILVDSPRSAYGDVKQDVAQLTLRAAVYAQLARSNTAVAAVERAAGLAPGTVTAAGPWFGVGERWNTVVPSPARGTQVRTEGNPWRISFDNDVDAPIVEVQAQAPTERGAIRLAESAGAGVRAAVAELRLQGALRARDQVVVRRVAPAEATLEDPGAAKILMVLAFAGVFLAGCLIVLCVATVAPHLRSRDERTVGARAAGAAS